MDWEFLGDVMDGADKVSDKELVKENQTGSIIGGGVALAAGVAMGITSLPLAVPLLIAGGALGGAAGEKGIKATGQAVKATGQAVTGFFGEIIKSAESFSEEVTKRVGDIKDFLKSDEDFILRGLERLKTGDYTGAITDFTKAIDINPNRADAYFFRGCVHSDERNYNNAIADYTKAIEVDTDYINAYLNRAYVYGFIGNERKAIDDYSYVIDHNEQKSDHIDIYMKRGALFFKLKEYEKSIRDYSQAITINPK
ncbi:MAG: tetratricopeptide repeat protein [Aphanizomenon gracile PMC644.10]|nr:tetratricopeptide repeat protein [Aphanizomenon gracile PMC644.10]